MPDEKPRTLPTVSLAQYDGYKPFAEEVRATLNVEAVLRCEVCGEVKLLTASIDPMTVTDRNGYATSTREAVRVALASVAERFDYQATMVAPIVPGPGREDPRETVTCCPPCRERIKRAVMTALRRA